MNILKIVFRNLKHRKLSSILTVISIMTGVALVISIMLIKQETEDAFNQTATGYEIIVGPKGSPLQLTLSTVYQIGNPIQNMPLSTYELLKNDKRVKLAIPYVLGDNFKNFRIVGTVPEIFTEFEYKKGLNYKFSEGTIFSQDLEAVIGSETSDRTGLKTGDYFMGSHGIESYEGSESHDEYKFKVAGVLEKTYTPVDRVIFVPMNAVWKIHSHEADLRKAETDSSVHIHKDEISDDYEKTITAVLLKLKSPVYFDLLRRQINDNKYEGINAQAILPVFEIKQLFDIIGNINSILMIISYLVIFTGAISIFVSIYNSINERKREIAILRSLGAKRSYIFRTIILEGFFISLTGALAGIFTSHFLIYIFRNKISDLTGIQISGVAYNAEELIILSGTVLLGILVSLLPAMKAYRTDVAENLSPLS
ncbi:MAG TPA: ABC transporter permease [Ignavibacteria bacterium]|nr:ABC transporter permease [Ignavibacteria bacterium]HMR41868.1 ABC transporter permease [Ignavibacteria bacterium]